MDDCGEEWAFVVVGELMWKRKCSTIRDDSWKYLSLSSKLTLPNSDHFGIDSGISY